MIPQDLLGRVKELDTFTIGVRRELHQHPELGFSERRTAGVIARHLAECGCQVTEGIGVTGVVGVLDTGRPGKTLMLRFDMDALPVQEANDWEFASATPGVMHACGHDGHMAIGLSVAQVLCEKRDGLSGRIVFCFQPAEEGYNPATGQKTGGAQAMISDGLLTRFEPDLVSGLHLWNEIPTGTLVVHAGALMAGADLVTIRILGKGGHGAQPHLAADPLVAAAQVLLALQTIVARNIPPQETVVLSITEMHGGEASNVIPSQVLLRGTLRSFSSEMRQLALARIEGIAGSVAGGLGCRAEVSIEQVALPVTNDAGVSDALARAVALWLPELEIDRERRLMVSEDMAYFLDRVPGCYFLVGAGGNPLEPREGHHHPNFSFDEQALQIGTAALAAFAAEILSPAS